jgi:uncharacterized RDD family membrane protein YckC
MWVQRTAEQTARWRESSKREARSDARLIAGLCLVLFPLLMAGGWFVGLRFGIVLKTTGGGFSRLLWFVLITLPFAWFVFRRTYRDELAKAERRTVCAQCDAGGEHPPGTACACGGTFVPASTVKWVDP